ncbi:hypothetical protein U9M48_016512, partial [Paspalum notatum var. saurae]
MENNSNSQAPPPPPPGYPTAAGAEQQTGRKGRRGKTTSRGEKGFIEGWLRSTINTSVSLVCSKRSMQKHRHTLCSANKCNLR